MIFFMSLSLIFQIIAFALIVGVCALAICIDRMIKAGETITTFQAVMLVITFLLFIWLSLRASMYGDELSKKN